MTMPSFRPARNQDASAVIRGFRYQIDHTLLRWMALGPDDRLELECGEDIDLVGRAFGHDSDESFDRLLEQIKLRSEKLSLRSPCALEAIANAVCHLLENPSLRLQFCYTTNAIATRERPCLFPEKLSGIALWRRLRAETLSDLYRTNSLKSLRQFLVAAAKPKKTREVAWSQFVHFFKTAHESQLMSFIQAFEWSCGEPDVVELSDRVRNELRILGIDDEDRLREVYERVFFFVFRLLTESTPKRLTKANLEAQLTAPTLSIADRLVLNRLQNRFDTLEDRVGDIEQSMAEITEDVQRLASQHGIVGVQINSIGLMSIDAPPLVGALSCRHKTVAGLVERLDDKSWFALYGVSDTGKTHLAALITRAKGKCCGWVRFHCSMVEAQALVTLHEALRRIGGFTCIEEPEGSTCYELTFSQLEPGSCLVLDDLPSLVGAPTLTQQLRQLVEACRARKVFLVSTSQFRLPANLVVVFGTRLFEIPIPRFSDLEARDVLASHGASDTFLTDSVVRFINELSSGHPLLLSLAAKFLKERDWCLNDSEFSGLMRGDHSTQIADDVLLRVCQSLDSEQRELLYRMTLAIGAIGDTDAMKLAAVEEAIERPKERLVGLIGAWVQRDTAQNLLVSPLARSLGKDNLAPTTFLRCHAVLGEIITQKKMSPWDAEIAVLHFLHAREFDRAGVLWLMLLSQFRTRKVVPELRSVLSLWYGAPLPIEMSLDLRVTIRAMQFWVLPRYKIALEPILSDLDQLMHQIGPSHAHAAHVVGSLASLFLASHDFMRATRYLSQSIGVLRSSNLKRAELLLPRGKSHVELLWTLIVNIQNRADLEAWVEAFKSLTPHEREVVIKSKDAALGSCVLADRLMLVETKQQPAQQQWNRVLVETLWLQKTAEEQKWAHLEAAARKSVINIQGEYLKTPQTCEGAVREYVNRDSVTASDKGLVSGMLGKMLTGVSQHRQALPWLKLAIASPDSGLPHDRMMTFLAATQSAASESQAEAVQFAEAAARIARENKSISNLEAVKAFGEWAIALAGTAATSEASLRAYPAWSEAANRMLNVCNRDNEWKDIFVLFGHINSYLVNLAITGHAPSQTADGEEYGAPRQGMFFTSHPERIDYYRDEFVPTVMWLLSQYAWKAGDESLATIWMKRAGDEIEGLPLTYITATITRDLVPDFLRADNFEDALTVSLRGAQVMVASNEGKSRSEASIAPMTPFDDVIAGMSPNGRRLAETFALISGVVPALLRVMTAAIKEPDNVSHSARQVASLCRQIAVSASDSTIWTGSADIFDAMGNGANDQVFLKLSNSFSETEYVELRVLGYLASTTASNAESAFRAQLVCIQSLLKWYPVDSAIYAQLLLPYLESFWTTTFECSRFQFRSPQCIESQLADAMTLAPRQRVRAILIALLPAFRTDGIKDAVTQLLNQ